MAYSLTSAARPLFVLSVLAAPFRVIWNGLIVLAEAGPMMAQVRALNALSDEDLAAKGKTREGEARRIFVGSYYI